MEKKSLPVFRYHPDPFQTGSFSTGDAVRCDCCGELTEVWYRGPFYAVETVDALCPWCIAGGRAHEKFDGEFQDQYSCEPADDPAVIEEVCFRTPGYAAWQQENWLAHCGDLCAFVGCMSWEEAKEAGAEEALLQAGADLEFEPEMLKRGIESGGIVPCVFRCLHCGAFRVDLNCD